MESPLVDLLFRRLFSTPARGCLRQGGSYRPRLRPDGCQRASVGNGIRHYAVRPRKDDPQTSNWQQRLDHFPRDMTQELRTYPKVTAAELRHRNTRPRRVRMLTRDFIDDSLYHPKYGYFPAHATIFNLDRPFDFSSIPNSAAFNKQVDRAYVEFEDALDAVQYDELRQLWHTPTELFRPYYGEAIARWLVTHYKMTLYPYHDLIIYEIGAGNGTMMRNILDYIKDYEPEVYERTKFKIIEIAGALADMQNANLARSPHYAEHLTHVQVINRSIFDWATPDPAPCFFLALEVIDNFAHDCLRYDPDTLQPLQGHVLIDEHGEFYEYFERTLDPLTARYLRVRDAASRGPIHTPVSGSQLWRKLKTALNPLAPNLTVPEYLPTRLLQFFDVLATYFPNHRLLLSDFTQLPTACAGINAPVVQTRYERRNVSVSTPYVHQGYFDIFFPTDFGVMEDVYRAVTGKLTRVTSHGEFLGAWGDLEGMTLGSGECVALGWYGNVGVLSST